MKLALVIFCMTGFVSCTNNIKLRGGCVGGSRERSTVIAVSKQHWFMYGSLAGKNGGGPLKNGYIALTTHNGDNVATHIDEEGNLVDVGISRSPASEGEPLHRYKIKTDKGVYHAKYIIVTKDK